MVIGLTGGLGSGKSTVAAVFNTLGAPVFDADKAGHWVLNHDEPVRRLVIELFGAEVYTAGHANRALIASRAFDDPNLLTQLNSAVHPAVGNRWKAFLNRHQATSLYVIREAAILIESGAAADCDFVVNVAADLELRFDRVRHQRGMSRADFEARAARQLSDDDRAKAAHFTLLNDGKQSVIDQVLALHRRFSAAYSK